MERLINIGCGKDLKHGFLNVDYPEFDLNRKLPYEDNQFDYGFARCVIPYVNNVDFSISEMRRICKALDVSFPHRSGGMPSQIKWGRVNFHSFGVNDLWVLEPDFVIIQFFYPLKRITLRNTSFNKRLSRVYDVYLSRMIPCRQVWCCWGNYDIKRGE